MAYSKRNAAWGLAAALAVLTGCAASGPLKTYEGPARAATETAIVTAPEQIEVMSIDGREPPPNFLRSQTQLALLPGEHVLSLRYVELFQLTADDHDVVRSRQAALRFSARAGGRYRLELPPGKMNHEAAQEFAKAPSFKLVSAQDDVVTESTPIKSYAEASLIDTIGKAFESQGEPERPVTNLDLLKDVWGRSSEDEKKAFRSWLDQQDKK